MLTIKVSILLLVLVCLCDTCYGQVSFSTNWGSGKRSSIFPLPTDQSSICLTRLEFNILKDLTSLVRRELRQATKCLQESKDFVYDFTNNQRFIEQ